jgi:hypothetical protein
MANVEEILFKMGIRTDGMSQGIQKAKAEVTNLGEHLEKKLSAKPGEGLKDLFQELIGLSPALGTAIKAAFNPITGGFAAAMAIFSVASEKLKEWNAQLDKQGESAARPVGKMRELMVSAQGKAAESQQQFDWWKKDLLEGKPGEVEQERIRKRVEEARVASGGDPLKFSQAKLAIMEDEKAKAKAQETDALSRAEDLQKTQVDANAIATQENKKAKIQEQLKKETELAEEIVKQEEKVKRIRRRLGSSPADADAAGRSAADTFNTGEVKQVEKLALDAGAAALGEANKIGKDIGDTLAQAGESFAEGEQIRGLLDLGAAGSKALGQLPSIPGFGMVAESDQDDLEAMKKREQEKLDMLMLTKQKTIDERKGLEKSEIDGGKLARENLHNLQETQAEATTAKLRAVAIDASINDERKTLFAEERKRREEDTENAIKEAEKKAGANKLLFIQEKLAIQQGALAKARSLGDDEQARKLGEAIKITEAERETEAINKAKAQEKFERDYTYQGTRIEQSRLSQDQITVDQLAGMPSWGGGFSAAAQAQGFQHNMDRQLLAMGGGVAGQFSDTAREYQMAQEESQMALLVSGKDSDRYKRAKLREESLQKDLGESGIVKIDVSMMKMAKAQEDLLEMARKEGLVVKPQMGK